MKVTKQLSEYIKAEMERRGCTAADLGRMGRASWMSWQRVAKMEIKSIRDETVDAFAETLGITVDHLRAIADGQDSQSSDAEALYAWVKADPNRCHALRAMGYRGELPK